MPRATENHIKAPAEALSTKTVFDLIPSGDQAHFSKLPPTLREMPLPPVSSERPQHGRGPAQKVPLACPWKPGRTQNQKTGKVFWRNPWIKTPSGNLNTANGAAICSRPSRPAKQGFKDVQPRRKLERQAPTLLRNHSRCEDDKPWPFRKAACPVAQKRHRRLI